jgi:peptidoglycan-associated lipoprotein
MNAKFTTASAVALTLVSASQAYAQQSAGAQPEGEKKGYFAQDVEAPTNAFELSVGTGYTQGFGSLQSGVGMKDVITPGFAVDLGLGYRIDPRWAVGLTGQYQEFVAERSSGARGLTAGLAAAYHFSPYTRTDPWLQLGTGYRLLWETHPDPTPNLLTHGFELAKLTLGVDIRVDKDVALAPVIGADLTLPLWQSVGGNNSVAINNPTVSTFVFAGLQGRFDVTSTHESGKPIMAKAVSETTITQAEVPKPPPVEETKPVSPSISVSEEVMEACKSYLDNVDKAPKFDFDKSALQAEDEAVLEKIAECFTSGPLKGANINLVGRADPRGTVEYNMALGMRRANSVEDALDRLGIDKGRIDATSRGELDATGTNEASWALDRRVDIMVKH